MYITKIFTTFSQFYLQNGKRFDWSRTRYDGALEIAYGPHGLAKSYGKWDGAGLESYGNNYAWMKEINQRVYNKIMLDII